MSMNQDKGWNPYLAGVLSGVVLIFSVIIAGKFFGASTSFVRSAGMIERIFVPEHVAGLEYFMKKVPKIEWQWMFVFGIFIGALISSITSRSFQIQSVPNMWERRFGSSIAKRAAVAFFGGLIAMFGARLAGG